MPLGTTLITGGAGNLARQLSADLSEAGHRVVLVDLPPSAAGPCSASVPSPCS